MMSFVNVAPELVEAAAHDLAGIGSTLGEATGLAAAPTTSIAAAGTDEVSTAIAALFGSHGQEFQALLNNQIGYAQTISTSVSSAAHDFITGLRGLPASFHTAFGDLAAGNTTGAVAAIDSGLGNLSSRASTQPSGQC